MSQPRRTEYSLAMRTYEVRDLAQGDEPTQIQALDEAMAAEIFCEQEDRRGDYDYASFGKANVQVRELGDLHWFDYVVAVYVTYDYLASPQASTK